MISKKIPAALFIVAALIAGVALVRDDGPGSPLPAADAATLPDPELMLAHGYGYEPLTEVAAKWRERVAEDADDYVSRTRLGRSLLGLARETGDLTLYERGERHLRRAVADAPGDVSAETGFAAALSAQHEFGAALDILTEIHDRLPNDLGIRAAIADAQISIGDYEEGFAAVDDLAGELPDNAATLSRQAYVAALTGRNDDAVELARRALILSADLGLRPSDSAASWFQLGSYQYQAGLVGDAEASLRSALTIDAGHLGSRELLGKVLVAENRLDEAATLYEDILEETPAADLHGLLAEIYTAQGRDGDAAEQLATGQALAEEQIGRFPAERRHLAGFLADVAPDLSLELARADAETRHDVYGLDVLAWALYLNDDIDGAREQMERALRLDTEDAPMLFHAGMIAVAAGDRDAGRDYLERALELNPRFDLSDAALAQATLDDL